MARWSGITLLSLLFSCGLAAEATTLRSSLSSDSNAHGHHHPGRGNGFQTLKVSVDTLTGQQSSLEARLDAFEARLALLESQLAPSSVQEGDHSGRRLQTTATPTFADLNNAVKLLQYQITGNATKNQGYAVTLVKSLSQSVSANLSSINSVITDQGLQQTAALNQAIQFLEDQIASNQTALVSALGSTSANFWQNITDIQSQIGAIVSQLSGLGSGQVGNPTDPISKAVLAGLAQIQAAISAGNATILQSIGQATSQYQQLITAFTIANQTFGPILGLIGASDPAAAAQVQAVLQGIILPIIQNVTANLSPYIPLFGSLNSSNSSAAQGQIAGIVIGSVVSAVLGQLNLIASSGQVPGLNPVVLGSVSQALNLILSSTVGSLGGSGGQTGIPDLSFIQKILEGVIAPAAASGNLTDPLVLAILNGLLTTNFSDPNALQYLSQALHGLLASGLNTQIPLPLNLTFPIASVANSQALQLLLQSWVFSLLQQSVGQLSATNPAGAAALSGLISDPSFLQQLLLLTSHNNSTPIDAQLIPLLLSQLTGPLLQTLSGNLTQVYTGIQQQVQGLEQQFGLYINQTVAGAIGQLLQVVQGINATVAQIPSQTGQNSTGNSTVLNPLAQILTPLTSLLGALTSGNFGSIGKTSGPARLLGAGDQTRIRPLPASQVAGS